jgi:hypothetical protein
MNIILFEYTNRYSIPSNYTDGFGNGDFNNYIEGCEEYGDGLYVGNGNGNGYGNGYGIYSNTFGNGSNVYITKFANF